MSAKFLGILDPFPPCQYQIHATSLPLVRNQLHPSPFTLLTSFMYGPLRYVFMIPDVLHITYTPYYDKKQCVPHGLRASCLRLADWLCLCRSCLSASACHGGLHIINMSQGSPNHRQLFISTEDRQEQIFVRETSL